MAYRHSLLHSQPAPFNRRRGLIWLLATLHKDDAMPTIVSVSVDDDDLRAVHSVQFYFR